MASALTRDSNPPPIRTAETASETMSATEAGSVCQALTAARHFLAAAATRARLDELFVEELILSVDALAVSTLARTVGSR